MRSIPCSMIAWCMIVVLGLAAGTVLATAAVEKGNVDELRFGTKVDAEGVVPAEVHAKHFIANTPIHVTMKVQEAPKGAKLLLNILDRETEELVWTETKELPGGHANMHFMLPAGSIKPGKYRAKVKLVDDWVAEHEFQVE